MFFDSVPRAADTVAADSTDRVFSRSDALRSTVDSATAADLASPDSLRRALVPQPQPYTLKFSPDLVTLGLGVSSYYGYAGGQWLLSFSDIMGDHRITLAGDLQYDFESTMHVFGSYMYLKNRIDIGGGAYYYKDYSLMGVTSDSLYFYDKETAAFVQASYPFSMFSRLDLQVFGRTINRTPRSLYTGYTPGEGTAQVNTLMPSLAYSYDNILWGMTGPLNGTRAAAALDLLPPVRFIDEPFLSLEADVRHYAHLWKRFVWANRIFIGASEPIGDNLSPRRYFLGGSENWLYTYSSKDINFREYRNFARNSFYSDIVVPFRGWRYFDLSGSRVAVLNTEFRFPFIKEFSLAWPLPFAIRYVNGAVFADVGNAWDPAEQTKTLPLPRTVNGGIGFGGRLNLGMFVLRYDRGWPANVTTASWSGGPINYFSMGAEF
jgi:hypothetical protein